MFFLLYFTNCAFFCSIFKISHGHKESFSCGGIKICVDWFKARGHREITVFVPMWRRELTHRADALPIQDRDILLQLEAERLLVFTPSRNVGGRRMICYDDRYILRLAAESDGIVVSNDNYRDLAMENAEYRKVVEERLLMYCFVNDRFMPPDDPLGRNGPSLDLFLKRRLRTNEASSPPCPYGKKCTYGNKCKYYHPERGNLPQKSVTELLSEQARARSLLLLANRGSEKLKACHTRSLPLRLYEQQQQHQQQQQFGHLFDSTGSISTTAATQITNSSTTGMSNSATTTPKAKTPLRRALTSKQPPVNFW